MNGHRFVKIREGLRLPYVERGDPEGSPVVLVPGFADTWRSMEPVLACLPKSIRAIAVTLRGHGDADKPGSGYSVRDYARDLVELLESLEIASAVLAGHSSGGLIAERTVLDHPERVRGLVLIATPLTLARHPRLTELWERTLSRLEDPIDPAFVREFQAGTFARPLPPEFLQMVVAESKKVPARVWAQTFEALLREDFTQELGNIRTPALLVWGDQDDIVTKPDQERLETALGDGRLLVYRGVGHSPHWEDPERFAADLVGFVSSIEPAG